MIFKSIKLKKGIAISIFLSLFIIGTILIFITPTSVKIRYNLTAETKDKEHISFNTYQPIESDKRMKAIIIGHGIMVNKEILKDFAIELAASGFFVVTCDFRGHGLSTGELNRGLLVNDVKAIKKYLERRDDIDNDNLGYVGYSMGGGPGNKIV
ncbi:MAG: alpha/beta fold hydrolase, partial [Candidatus Lokiarchaeota archaeon]|nr:alpha/beta fold hydrolase [Candidatus Lokiarchaeota archaeon]MBD3339374.1 alpha/beta fold hydrolase [Candidatus Lokiarchaeota archaeon]